MSRRTVRLGVGIAMTLVLAGSVALLADLGSRRGLFASETQDAFARACAGLPSNRQVERTLFLVRAQTTGGFDPICSSAAATSAQAGQEVTAVAAESGELTAADALDPKREHRRRF